MRSHHVESHVEDCTVHRGMPCCAAGFLLKTELLLNLCLLSGGERWRQGSEGHVHQQGQRSGHQLPTFTTRIWEGDPAGGKEQLGPSQKLSSASFSSNGWPGPSEASKRRASDSIHPRQTGFLPSTASQSWTQTGPPACRRQQGQADGRYAAESDAEASVVSRHQTAASRDKSGFVPSSEPCGGLLYFPSTATKNFSRREPAAEAPAPRRSPAFETQTSPKCEPQAIFAVQAWIFSSRPKATRWWVCHIHPGLHRGCLFHHLGSFFQYVFRHFDGNTFINLVNKHGIPEKDALTFTTEMTHLSCRHRKGEYLEKNELFSISPSRFPSSVRQKVVFTRDHEPSEATTSPHQAHPAAAASCLHVSIVEPSTNTLL